LSAQERDELAEFFGPNANSLVWGTADAEAYEEANVGWLCYAMVILEPPHRVLAQALGDARARLAALPRGAPDRHDSVGREA
jgi:hypothetical protein